MLLPLTFVCRLCSSYSHGYGEEFSGIAWRSALINARILGRKVMCIVSYLISSMHASNAKHTSSIFGQASRDVSFVTAKSDMKVFNETRLGYAWNGM